MHILIHPFLFIRELSCSSCIQASLSLNCLKLTILGFLHNCLPVSCGDIGFLKKILGLVLAWKSGLKVPLLLGPSCHLQTKSAQNGHYYLHRAVTPYPASSNLKKVRQTAFFICRGLSPCHTRPEHILRKSGETL